MALLASLCCIGKGNGDGSNRHHHPPPPLPGQERSPPCRFSDPATRGTRRVRVLLPRSCPPFDYVIPRVPSPPAHPLLAPNPLIIFTRRSDSPAPGGPIPFTFHYELAAIPAIEPATFFSSRLCRGHLHLRRLVSVLPDRRRCLRSVIGWSPFLSLSLSLALPFVSFSRFLSLCPSSPTSDPRHRRCMCGPRRLPDGSGISEFPRAC